MRRGGRLLHPAGPEGGARRVSQTLVKHWSNTGQTLVKHWSNNWSNNWSNTGQTTGQATGQTLVLRRCHCASTPCRLCRAVPDPFDYCFDPFGRCFDQLYTGQIARFRARAVRAALSLAF
jgi:hypothetical protein